MAAPLNVRLVSLIIGERFSFAASAQKSSLLIAPDLLCFFQHSLGFDIS
jgi:hypothetical protein